MSYDLLLVRDVTILTPDDVTDRYGNTVDDWTSPTTTTTEGWLSRLTAEELSDDRVGHRTIWRLYLPAGTTVTQRDRVTIDGDTYEVDGPASQEWTPRGEHHVEVELRRVVG